MRAIEHAEQALAHGNLWRAKEILQGSIPNAGYDADLFEMLGLVLLKMGDLPEAGRFLFLSGRRDPSVQEAVQTFLSRHRKNPRGLYQSFPRPAKLVSLAEYSDPLRSELKALGFPELLRAAKPDALPVKSDWLACTIAIVIAGSTLVLALLGVVKIIEIWHWLKTV